MATPQYTTKRAFSSPCVILQQNGEYRYRRACRLPCMSSETDVYTVLLQHHALYAYPSCVRATHTVASLVRRTLRRLVGGARQPCAAKLHSRQGLRAARQRRARRRL
jgi:hypothetical protein